MIRKIVQFLLISSEHSVFVSPLAAAATEPPARHELNYMQLQRTTTNDNAKLSMGNCVIWNVEEFILFLNIIVGLNKSRCYSILNSLRMRSTAVSKDGHCTACSDRLQFHRVEAMAMAAWE